MKHTDENPVPGLGQTQKFKVLSYKTIFLISIYRVSIRRRIDKRVNHEKKVIVKLPLTK
jgi:hypothetical protein